MRFLSFHDWPHRNTALLVRQNNSTNACNGFLRGTLIVACVIRGLHRNCLENKGVKTSAAEPALGENNPPAAVKLFLWILTKSLTRTYESSSYIAWLGQRHVEDLTFGPLKAWKIQFLYPSVSCLYQRAANWQIVHLPY